ncbi:acyl-CoA thioester hydrolase [Enterococcus sp. 10A9_DIV0425]|uniref:Acyl-CoA thioester hydrolase n=1 Tax=Candidatus Enterococcus wittei TaxID=1987383 RepID=A0A242K058_9ENTE|nr:thioesterase family protein [Enterococcus sp. 10A9_DIV0425]OTP11038.1 acyl-CoA thioester hydrolase [Enterococcus sp. 10A9_DIV0425]THE10068.1 acyl-CoA thioesterase [Enterococcus hirae]
MEKYNGYFREPFYYETDQMGIIHHSNYIRWFEEARVALLEHLNFSYQKIEKQGIIIPVLEVSCQYKEMIRYGDRLRIQPIIANYTGSRLDFSYEIYGLDDQRLRTTGTSKHCFLLAKNQRLTKLSRNYPELDHLFQAYAKLEEGNI